MVTFPEFIAKKADEGFTLGLRSSLLEKYGFEIGDYEKRTTPKETLAVKSRHRNSYVIEAKRDGKISYYFLKRGSSETDTFSEKEGYDKIKQAVEDNVPEMLVYDKKNKCIVYQYIEGKIIVYANPENIPQANAIVSQVADIHKKIHSHKQDDKTLIHKDARLSNYILDSTGKINIIDFHFVDYGNVFWDFLVFSQTLQEAYNNHLSNSSSFYLNCCFDGEPSEEYKKWAKGKTKFSIPFPNWFLKDQGMK
jgi:tRNA A-37 threonylcarbamoyl transferase component Bud32